MVTLFSLVPPVLSDGLGSLRLCHCGLSSGWCPAGPVHAMNVRCSKLTVSNIALFSLILFLCLALNPNNQYNLGSFCSINATLLMQRKPRPYWLQELQDWILDPTETNGKTCIDFSGSRIGPLMLAVCLCQGAGMTRNERHQICWQEIRSAPQNSKAEFPIHLWWMSFTLGFCHRGAAC